MPRFFKHLLIWTLICGAAAAPSFALGGMMDDTALGMTLGVVLFILGYTFASGSNIARRLYADRRRRRAIQIGFATRVALSMLSALVFLEVGFYFLFPDLLCGAVTAGLAKEVFGRDSGFAFALLATVLQGVALNVVLAVYTLLVYVVCRLAMAPDDASRPQGFEVLPLATPAIPLAETPPRATLPVAAPDRT